MSDNLQMTQEGRKYIAAQKAKQEGKPEYKDCSTCATDCDWPDGYNCHQYTKKTIEHRDMVQEELIASQAREAELREKLEAIEANAQIEIDRLNAQILDRDTKLEEQNAELRKLLEESKVPEGWQLVASGKYGEFLLPFVVAMNNELHANAGKGDRAGWLSMSRELGVLEIYYHTAKLQKAVKDCDVERIREYSADVANMSMMILDICGGLLAAAPQPKEQPSPETDLDEALRRQ